MFQKIIADRSGAGYLGDNMSYITKREYEAGIGGWAWIESVARSHAQEYITKFGDSRESVESVDIIPDDDNVEDGIIEIETEVRYCGCCSPEIEEYTLPISYLWDNEWVSKEEVRREEERRKQEEKDRRRKEEREKEMKEARYQRYLQLKEEFEG